MEAGSRPGPDVFPTKEPQGQSPLRGATVRKVHYFHSTAQPQVSHWSGAGVGFRVSGRRWWWTSDNGKGRLSLRTQAVNPKQGWNLQGQDHQRVRDSEPETRNQTKESVTPPKETSSQKVQSTWPPKRGRTVEASGTQSTWPVQCGRTSEGFWKSSRTGLCHPAHKTSEVFW